MGLVSGYFLSLYHIPSLLPTTSPTMAKTVVEHLGSLLAGLPGSLPISERNALASYLYFYLRKERSALWDVHQDPNRLVITPAYDAQKGGYCLTLFLYTAGGEWEPVFRGAAKPELDNAMVGMTEVARLIKV